MKGKTVILGVTGSVAAYKAVEIARRLMDKGATVKVVMTEAATRFITPLTFETLTRQPVATSMFNESPAGKIYHLSLSEEADLILVAPATANILAKAARGIADDLLSTALTSATCPLIFAPAMNSKMYQSQTVQDNIAVLSQRGAQVLPSGVGKLACDREGIGRLPGVAQIIEAVERNLQQSKQLCSKTIVVTAGGTREFLDPVRFISNRSSGKMGYALARAAWRRGAQVVLISGPTALPSPYGIELISVVTTEEMRQAVLKHFKGADAVIMAAAVADFKPANVQSQKIKKNKQELTLKLNSTPDILKELGQSKKKDQVLVGFAAETKDLVKQAKMKLKKKNLDLVVANDVTQPGSGFQSDTNRAILVGTGGKTEKLPLMLKDELADFILERVVALLTSWEMWSKDK